MLKKISKKITHRTLSTAKKIIQKNPRIKNTVKKAVMPHIGGVHAARLSEYQHWLQVNFPDAIECARLKRESAKLTYRPLISVVIPTYDTNIEYLRDCLDSVYAQVYENWEICIVDDASPNENVRRVIQEYADKDSRIKYKFLTANKHIAGATNEAVALASGEFVSLFDHDDLLWPNALYEIVKALNANKDIDFLYTDEDKITENRYEHLGPFFKPDWNPDFLHSVNYITHFSTIRRSVLESVGGLREEYNGAQDWDLFLRITSHTNKIHHIPKIVYSWRIHDLSTAKSTDTKPYVVEAQRKAISDDLSRKGYDNYVLERDKKHKGYWNLSYVVQDNPLISIVIPSKNQYKVIKRCLDSIYSKSTYKNFEIIIVDTGSDEARITKLYEKYSRLHDNFRVIDWPEQPFSYARSCNEGARHARGELLLMLNNDTEVLTPNWLELLAGDAQRQEIGAVGCLLFFPDKYHIQHAGVGVGLGGVAANSFSMMSLDQPLTQTQHIMLNTKHNMTVVTAACLMIKKELYDTIGGFDELFRVTYNDVDLCLRLYEAGYQNLYTPHVRLVHHESISVGLPSEIKKRDTKEMRTAKEMFTGRWQKYIDHDPNLNQNLSKDDAFYDIKDPLEEKKLAKLEKQLIESTQGR